MFAWDETNKNILKCIEERNKTPEVQWWKILFMIFMLLHILEELFRFKIKVGMEILGFLQNTLIFYYGLMLRVERCYCGWIFFVVVLSFTHPNRTPSIRSEFTFCMPENHQADIYFHPLFWWVDDCIMERIHILFEIVCKTLVAIIKNQFLTTVSYPICILIFWQRSK